jgi:sugar lactone lactonase YvrE
MAAPSAPPRALPLLVVLLAGALMALLLRNAVARNGPLADDLQPYPVFVLAEPGGNVLVVEHGRNQILRVQADGAVSLVAGNGTSEFSGDGGPATAAGLFLMSIARDSKGNLYIADHNHHRVRRVDRDGRISTVAGTGEAGFSGDGGPATKAKLNDPAGVAVSPDGTLTIADSANHRIRRVDAGGRIATVAGTGEAGFSGDGGPADQAKLDFPWGISFSFDGALIIADTGNNRIRRVSTDGTIATVAGSGSGGFAGDGGLATRASIERPQMAVADRAGNLTIADTNNNRIRRVDTAGKIRTVVGSGRSQDPPDGRPTARTTGLDGPFAVAVADDGTIYIADTGNFRVLRVTGDGEVRPLALKR